MWGGKLFLAIKGTSSVALRQLLQRRSVKMNAVATFTLLLWRRCPEGADEVPLLAKNANLKF